MPTDWADLFAALGVYIGLFFLLVGAVGIVRFPDVYYRLHAASKCSTLGLLGMLVGAVIHIGSVAVLIKAVLTLMFAFLATPVGSHVLAKAAHATDAHLWRETISDDLAEDKGELPPV